MFVITPFYRYGHQVQVAVTHPPARNELIGEALDSGQRAAQDAGLQTMIVVEVDVQGGHRQVVMVMLGIGELAGQVAPVVVVDVGENADAIAFRILLGALMREKPPEQIAYGLGTAFVSQPLPVALERFGKLLVQ